MKFLDLLNDQDVSTSISRFYSSWQKYEEKANSYFSSKDIVVANFSNSPHHPQVSFDSNSEVLEAAQLLLDKIAEESELKLARRKIEHSIRFLEQKGPDRILSFLQAEEELFHPIDLDVLKKYHDDFITLEAQIPKNNRGSRLNGARIKDILETKGISLLNRMGFEKLLQKHPFEVIEANTNDGWMILVCMEEKPKIFVQTNPNNNFPEDSGFFEILVHEMAHYCHFATILDKKAKSNDPTENIFCLHGVDGFFIEGVAQYLTEVIFSEFDVTIQEKAAKALWELKSAVMYYNLYSLACGLIDLDQASEIHCQFLGGNSNLAKRYEALMNDRLMATQMFNYFGSLRLIKNNTSKKDNSNNFNEYLCIRTPEQFKKLFTS